MLESKTLTPSKNSKSICVYNIANRPFLQVNIALSWVQFKIANQWSKGHMNYIFYVTCTIRVIWIIQLWPTVPCQYTQLPQRSERSSTTFLFGSFLSGDWVPLWVTQNIKKTSTPRWRFKKVNSSSWFLKIFLRETSLFLLFSSRAWQRWTLSTITALRFGALALVHAQAPVVLPTIALISSKQRS